MPNVFISHRKDDDALAEALASEIRAAGHTVWLDEWNIGIGDSIVAKINEGLQGATYVVICYSASGVMSPWMSREWMSALAQQMNGFNVRVLPVKLSGNDVPAILADIKSADLVKDWKSGIQSLLLAIK